MNYEDFKYKALSIWAKITDNTPLASLFALFVCALVVIILTAFLKGEGHWQGVLVEAWGMLFDLLVIGAFVTYLVSLGEKRQKIQAQKDIIDDYRPSPDEVAAPRIRGAILRLNRLGVHEIKLEKCHINDVDLSFVNLRESNLSNAHCENTLFHYAHLEGVDFIKTHLEEADFYHARLDGADLSGSYLIGASLIGAYLVSGVCLEGADLSGAVIMDAHLDNAYWGHDLEAAVEQLSKVKTLHNTTGLDEVRNFGPELKRRLKKDHKELFDIPSEDK